ncbi:beta-phosphoglucomutase [Clostridium sp.]|uniref:beta-phosphoglucomutase n=1 Tax=Clostridium sp. TaxID=1506 RepID=UPI002639774E|nr:beta-phosphoglucomutase [uncultured Clostridium sp.]
MSIKGVIFDLDGVIVSTDEYHYKAWKAMAVEEDICFDYEINHRLRGVSRMESLEIILEKAKKTYTAEEKIGLANKKNDIYVELLGRIGPKDIFPGVRQLIDSLKKLGIKLAIGSSSKNAVKILDKIGLNNYFDAVADGNQIVYSKPNPEVFLLASKLFGVAPEYCAVVEDAEAGIEAAISANMKAIAVGSACNSSVANLRSTRIGDFTAEDILKLV